jgi:iron-sulfur cluster assembly protein
VNVETTTRTRPAALILTPTAEARIAALMSRAPEGTVGVKLSTPRRGCSGLAYSVDYVTEAKPFDERIETPGGTFFVDAGSILYLIGSRVKTISPRVLCSTTRMPRAPAAAARASPSELRAPVADRKNRPSSGVQDSLQIEKFRFRMTSVESTKR